MSACDRQTDRQNGQRIYLVCIKFQGASRSKYAKSNQAIEDHDEGWTIPRRLRHGLFKILRHDWQRQTTESMKRVGWRRHTCRRLKQSFSILHVYNVNFVGPIWQLITNSIKHAFTLLRAMPCDVYDRCCNATCRNVLRTLSLWWLVT